MIFGRMVLDPLHVRTVTETNWTGVILLSVVSFTSGGIWGCSNDP